VEARLAKSLPQGQIRRPNMEPGTNSEKSTLYVDKIWDRYYNSVALTFENFCGATIKRGASRSGCTPCGSFVFIVGRLREGGGSFSHTMMMVDL
jgi:hypothetical protein